MVGLAVLNFVGFKVGKSDGLFVGYFVGSSLGEMVSSKVGW